MNQIPLPGSWSAGRSVAALMTFSGLLAGAPKTKRLIQLMHWELEKYGSAFHEPPSTTLLDEGARFWGAQCQKTDIADPRALGRFHGGEILRRRGRELLDAALSACVRVASLGSTPERVVSMLADAARHSVGDVSIVEDGGVYHMGPNDDAALYADAEMRPPFPGAADFARCVELWHEPEGWTEAHAVSFLLHAGHFADRLHAPSLPDSALDDIKLIAETLELPTSADSLDAITRAGFSLLERCSSRYTVLRAVEDQLMYFAVGSLELRTWLLHAVNRVVARGESLTPLRRQIVTTTMAVLATSPEAMRRPRQCLQYPA